jgi:hypothetical protein
MCGWCTAREHLCVRILTHLPLKRYLPLRWRRWSPVRPLLKRLGTFHQNQPSALQTPNGPAKLVVGIVVDRCTTTTSTATGTSSEERFSGGYWAGWFEAATITSCPLHRAGPPASIPDPPSVEARHCGGN